MQLVLKALLFPGIIKSIGYLPSMDDYEKRKLGIFNVINVLGFFIGICLPIIGLSVPDIKLTEFAWAITFSPAMVSLLVLILNYCKLHDAAALCYFIMYPILTALVYRVSFDIGIELFFILYGVLSVFFLQRFLYIAFSFALTLLCYFYCFVFKKDYDSSLYEMNFPFYVLNHLLPAVFIFYALFLIKKENSQYQYNILGKNRELHRVNLEIQKQKEVIDDKAKLLQQQNELIDEKARLLEQRTGELSELNSMKNKLFSVISHDLKAPLYAIRNLFKSVQQYDLPAEDIKTLIPDVIKDLNYTTSLMENLLTWVKSQMQIIVMQPQLLDASELIKEALDLLRLQAHSKDISIELVTNSRVYVYADKEMISLVIRNLLSNAIKFTPQQGTIKVGMWEKSGEVEIYVKDSGVGMKPETVKQLFGNNFYTTKGTDNETGTGLGLVLCRDFLQQNKGAIHVSSEPGKGSTFSFTLPRKIS